MRQQQNATQVQEPSVSVPDGVTAQIDHANANLLFPRVGAQQVARQLSMLHGLFTHEIQGALAGELAWANPLTVDEREDMKRELSIALVAAMATGHWPPYDDALSAWRLTAEVAGDPELEADLLADSDDAEDVPLRRP